MSSEANKVRSRRDFLKAAGSFAAGATVVGTAVGATQFAALAVTQTANMTKKMNETVAYAGKPNVVLFFVDNLGFGELGCYGGGILRGAPTGFTIR